MRELGIADVVEADSAKAVEGAKLAQAILRSGDTIACAYTAQQVMKMIAEANNDH